MYECLCDTQMFSVCVPTRQSDDSTPPSDDSTTLELNTAALHHRSLTGDYGSTLLELNTVTMCVSVSLLPSLLAPPRCRGHWVTGSICNPRIYPTLCGSWRMVSYCILAQCMVARPPRVCMCGVRVVCVNPMLNTQGDEVQPVCV
jgi:hypothetical protein